MFKSCLQGLWLKKKFKKIMCEFSKRDKCLHDLMELYHFLSRKIDILMFEEE